MAGEFFEDLRQLAAQCFGLEELPFIVSRAIAQRKARHEIIVVERGGFGERHDATRAYVVRRVVVGLNFGEARVKLVHIHDEFGMGIETDRFPVGVEMPFA